MNPPDYTFLVFWMIVGICNVVYSAVQIRRQWKCRGT